MGQLDNRHVLSHSPGGWKSEIRCLQGCFSLRAVFGVCRWQSSLCVLTWASLLIFSLWIPSPSNLHQSSRMVVVLVAQLCPTLCNPMVCPWGSPGKNTGVDSLSLLQGIFLTQGWKPRLLPFLHWQGDSLPPHHLGSPTSLLLHWWFPKLSSCECTYEDNSSTVGNGHLGCLETWEFSPLIFNIPYH